MHLIFAIFLPYDENTSVSMYVICTRILCLNRLCISDMVAVTKKSSWSILHDMMLLCSGMVDTWSLFVGEKDS